MKKSNGITLIALVITIIVLLILAGVSIAMISGDDGIATRANQAKTETKEKSLVEEVKVYLNEFIIERKVSGDSVYPEDVVEGLEYKGDNTEIVDGVEKYFEIYTFKGNVFKAYFNDDYNITDVIYLREDNGEYPEVPNNSEGDV